MDEPESDSVLSADLHVCIFPNLDEFMVIDVRDLEAPKARVMPAAEVLTATHYDDLEAEFSRLLRTEGPPFLNLMLLSARGPGDAPGTGYRGPRQDLRPGRYPTRE